MTLLSLRSLTLFAMALVYSQSTLAVTRHCQGQMLARYAGTSILLTDFTGKGTDPYANRARNRARDWIARCGFDHFNKRWDLIGSNSYADLPNNCSNYNVYGINQLEIDIKSNIARQGCALWGPWIQAVGGALPVEIVLKSYGDKGCGDRRKTQHQWTVSSPYFLTTQMCAQGW